MCGILGLISSQDKQGKDKFALALSKSKHRGPDGSKIIEINESCLFGFNRLAIQDLSENSMQPFSYEGNWLIFNGEIYNFIELRESLKSQGAKFNTTGDAEVLAVGLTYKGSNFLNEINGIFAFVFYDSRKRTYLVARDRMGVKPLFYYQGQGKLIFSSEVKSMLEYVQPKLNLETLYTHLFLDWFIGYRKNETFFDGIQMLENGTYRIYDIDCKLIENKKYYQPDFANKFTNFSEIEREFPKLVERAFLWETRSDAKVGIAFSGGIDTSTILTLATPHLIQKQDKIPVYTFYYQQKGENTDLLYARKIISYLLKKYGDVFDVYEYNMDSEIEQQDFENTVLARETPIFDIRYITITKLYREIRKTGIKVSLSGQGSDEVFYGYYPLDYWLSRFYREGVLNVSNVIDYFQNTLNTRKTKIIRKEFLEQARESSKKHLRCIFEEIEKVEPQPKKLTALIRETMLPSFMLYEDKFGMYSGLEIRVPMINPLLVEYIDQCDYKVNLLSSNAGRHLFRNMLRDKLPEEIRLRGKTPTPKKKKYSQELQSVYLDNKKSIVKSDLLNLIYKKEFLENPFAIISESSNAFYGNADDVILELLGLYFFERNFLISESTTS
jgi:asparagine synthase (glutamine-hydrolysing)